MSIEEVLNETQVRHYSDKAVKIRQIETGVVYEDAVDVRPCQYTYEETDEPIESDATPEELLSILLGGEQE